MTKFKRFVLSTTAVCTFALVAMTTPAQACNLCNGLKLNGTEFNGCSLQGVTLQGMKINGWKVNGMKVNGMKVNGMRINGTAMHTMSVGKVAAVTLPDGETFVLAH